MAQRARGGAPLLKVLDDGSRMELQSMVHGGEMEKL
jgi:hypothetical protein